MQRIYGTKISLILPDTPSIECGWINSTDTTSNLSAQTFSVLCPRVYTRATGVMLEDRTGLSRTSDKSVIMNVMEVTVYGTG